VKYLVLLTLASAGQLVFAQGITVLPSGVPGIQVTGSRSAAFQALADRVLGTSIPPATKDWLPYSFTLTNNTAQTVVGLAVRCVTIDPNGITIPISGLNTIPAFDSIPRFNSIKPGETAVVLPMRILSASTPMVTRDVSSMPNQAQQLEFLRSASEVEISLDGVVFDTGQFAGPDATEGYELAVNLISDRQKMASAILAKRAAGEPVSSVVDWLTTIVAQAAPAARGRGGVGQSPSLKPAIARGFLAAYRAGGEQELYAKALSYEKPAATLHR